MSTTGIHPRRRRIALAAALATGCCIAVAAAGAAPAGAAQTCTWGGTPAAPTGTLTITPGVTNVPSAGPLEFRATGLLAGGGACSGRMTWVGQLDAGSTCGLASFEGAVKGLPGVARFWGRGNVLVPSQLYDGAGRLVGIENAQIATAQSSSHYADCLTPGGFAGGWPNMFSSVVELYGARL
jgi:hypothetical protein